jgi:hypothetical protein
MIDDRYMELMNKAVSGEITPDEQTRLDKYLQATPEAAKIYRQMLETSEVLGGIGDVEPPASLKPRIMNALDFSRYETRPSRSVSEAGLLARFGFLSPRRRPAYAFALGVVVGLIIFSVIVTRPPGSRYPADIRNLYGTIGLGEDKGFASIERVPVSLGQVTGSIDLSRLGDVLMFEVSLGGAPEFDLLLVYDPTLVSFGGLRPHEGGQALVAAGRGYVETSVSGDCVLNLSFIKERAASASVDLKLMSSGRLLMGHRFVLAAADES